MAWLGHWTYDQEVMYSTLGQVTIK